MKQFFSVTGIKVNQSVKITRIPDSDNQEEEDELWGFAENCDVIFLKNWEMWYKKYKLKLRYVYNLTPNNQRQLDNGDKCSLISDI